MSDCWWRLSTGAQPGVARSLLPESAQLSAARSHRLSQAGDLPIPLGQRPLEDVYLSLALAMLSFEAIDVIERRRHLCPRPRGPH